jgi:DNA repair exonuclease SbcCD ATPase subunit
MADSDELLDTEIEEIEEVEEESELEDEYESEAEAEEEDEDEGEDDELVVTIGEDSPPPEEATQAPEWVRDLRKQYREEKKYRKELERKLQEATKGEEKQAATLPSKPTLEAADYDTDRYENMLANWYERKRQYEAEQEAVKQKEQQVQSEWQQKLESYSEAKASLRVRDFEDAEDLVTEQFSTTQQGMILAGADNPALLVYALGKNPRKAAELASIQDPVKFAFTLAKMETQLKTSKRSAPPPERTVKGTGTLSGSVDRTLERLREEAAKTGDFTKVVAYKRQKRG